MWYDNYVGEAVRDENVGREWGGLTGRSGSVHKMRHEVGEEKNSLW